MNTTIEPSSAAPEDRGNQDDRDYEGALASINAWYAKATRGGAEPVFLVEAAASVWKAYVEAFPEDRRQHHNCIACRDFVCHYGGLVTIDAEGNAHSAIWDDVVVPDAYYRPIKAMREVVESSAVCGVYLSSEDVWGKPKTGPWCHFSVTRPGADFHHSVLTAGQVMSQKREDHTMVCRVLSEFELAHFDQAVAIFRTEAIPAAEKHLAHATWLAELSRKWNAALGSRLRSHLVWRAVATAPAGYAHVRTTMVGTMLEDLRRGTPMERIRQGFLEKTRGDRYQRPQAPPSVGQIAAAEKLVEQMGIARSLERRFARLEEIETQWKPAPPPAAPNAGGVFGHLTPKGAADPAPVDVGGITNVTWEKFQRKVLPDAQAIDLLVTLRANFGATLTAEHPDAPPILLWDREDRRNPFSWYVYYPSSAASNWNLQTGWTKVVAIARHPATWYGGDEREESAGALFVLEGCRDLVESGSAIFPATLRSELHGVRATIEAYSNKARPGGRQEASACGFMISKAGGGLGVVVSVTLAGGVTARYRIDRWD